MIDIFDQNRETVCIDIVSKSDWSLNAHKIEKPGAFKLQSHLDIYLVIKN